MGAVLEPEADPAEFLKALDRLARHENLALIELEQRGLSEHSLAAAGFEAVEGLTYWVELAAEEAMLKRLHKGRRSGVKKAIASGLVAERTDSVQVAEEFYDQFCGVMRTKGLVPGFSRDCARSLFEALSKIDRVLGVRVRDSAGRLLATGLFPFDNRTMYFWGGSDTQQGRQLCPNDFLHWSAMCWAAELGMRRYDMSGYGRFKREFGGELVTIRRWHKNYWRAAKWARQAYAILTEQRLRARAWLASRQAPPAPAAESADGEDV
jgi:lipid II:glycine glycyltransferase (peptidoglycan interpeptide bridge formation enzyme)